SPHPPLLPFPTRRSSDLQLEQAHAMRDQAEANLSRTAILAPVAGRVTKLTVAKGAYAQPGQALFMFVPRDVWVTANFKETQLTRSEEHTSELQSPDHLVC